VADQFDVFKKEIEEDLQRDRMLRLWEAYGTYLIAAAVGLVLAVGGYQYMQGQKRAATEADARLFQGAAKAVAEKSADAEKQLAGLADRPGSYAALARLKLASVHITAGAKDKALAAFDALAQDSSVDKLLSDYAALQAGLLKLDAGDLADARNRLGALATDQNPWRHQAREALGLAALKANDLPAAREVLQKVVGDAATPRSISERAQIMLGQVVQSDLATAPGPTKK
jgi:hypothetical protein